MSSAPSVRDALEGYVAGRLSAEQLVAVVAAEYYGERAAAAGGRRRERLRPLVEIIERAHPGVVELVGSSERPGFAVRVAERPFPKRYEAELRQAVQALLTGGFADDATSAPRSPLPVPSLLRRILTAIRNAFRS